MATVNLGRIKFIWQGAYSGATSYVIDDVVSYNGSSFICTANSTGNLPTDTNYWSKMAQGSDLGSISGLTTNDLIYFDGTNFNRLAIGSANSALKVNSGATGYTFGTAGGVIQRKIIHDNSNGSVASNTPVQWTPFNMTFTPTAAGNILELEIHDYWSSAATQWGGYFYDSTNNVVIGVGAPTGSHQVLSFINGINNAQSWVGFAGARAYYTAPSNTAIAFRVYIGTHGSTTFYHNRNVQNTNNNSVDNAYVTSSFTITEYASGVYTGSGQTNV